MEEQLVSFKVARLAKEKGFDWSSELFFNEEGEKKRTKIGMHGNPNNLSDCYSAPTQSALQKWLRDTHKINIAVNHRPHSQTYYFSITGKYNEDNRGVLYEETYNKHPKYEIALEEGLQKTLELIK